ncbi:MAG: MBL fold metallo-hydrolase [Caldilinea sp.]
MTHAFNQLTDHVYWLSPDSTTDRPVLGVIAGATGSLIVDAGNSPAHARVLLDQIDAANLPAPRYLVVTHWHWDHWFATAAYNLPTVAHASTRRILAAQATWDWSDAALDARVAQGAEIAFCRDMIKAELPERNRLVLRPPDLAFDGELEIDLGGVTCRLIHVGGDHAADSIIVHAPEDRVVFLSDCRYEDIYATPRRYTVANALPLFDRLLALEADLYLGGHEPAPLLRPALVEEALRVRHVGKIVERIGDDRVAVIDELRRQGNLMLDEDTLDCVDAFLAGLRKGG